MPGIPITVITPVYNSVAQIPLCLQNVIDQVYPEKQHLIIDGASTDGTKDILSTYSARYDHIEFISEKDLGISDALNKGVKAAPGEIIGILNVDDSYEEGILSRAAKIFSSNPSLDIIAGNCRLKDLIHRREEIFTPSLELDDLLKGDLLYQFPINPSSYFYKKELHERVGYYSQEEDQGMDLDFLLRSLKVANAEYFDELWGNMSFTELTRTYKSYSTGELWEMTYRLLRKYTPKRPFHKYLYYVFCQNLFTRYGRDRIKLFFKRLRILR